MNAVTLPLLALLAACPKAPPAPAAGPSTAPLLEVSTIVVGGRAEACAFNEDRPWVLNVHQSLDDGAVEADLAQAVQDAGLSGQVVLDWFGEEAPSRLEVVLGRDLPVALASAAVRVARAHTDRDLVVSAAEDQSTTCSRSQAYVGSLLPTDNAPTSTELLDLLSRQDIGAEEFWSRVPASGR